MQREQGGRARTVGRWLLAGGLLVAGIGHFTMHEEFLGQVPDWLPARSWIVWVSGVMEVALAVALVGAPPRHRRLVGWIAAGFFVAVFPGNIHQAVAGTDAFGLDTSTARWVRLLFQPPLVLLALWSTGAWPRRSPARSVEARGPTSRTPPRRG
jgi:uncharacterized membrane protein